MGRGKRGKSAHALNDMFPSEAPTPPACLCVSDPTQGGRPGPWTASVFLEKSPPGFGCIPPAGDSVGAQIEPINPVKAKRGVVLTAILSEVRRSGFHLSLVWNWEAIVTCLVRCGFFLLLSTKGRLAEVRFCLFYFIFSRRVGKRSDRFETYKGLQFKGLLHRARFET